MDLWFTEKHSKNLCFSIKISKQLHSFKSEFQNICVFESEEFGRFLTLDGFLMFTEKDEFIYHEMITHIPISVNLNTKNVLVIGGGDGGVVREVIKYPFVEKIDVCEIDSAVVSVCRRFFPKITSGLDDKRVSVYFEDGMKFIRSKQNEYDLIIVDSTDPFGPGEALFTKEFYGSSFKSLTSNGILVNQHESVFYAEYTGHMIKVNKILKNLFKVCRIYQAHIPTYPSGHWLFGFASKTYEPIENLDNHAWKQLNIKTKYYNTDLHVGAFKLPTYVNEVFA